MISVVIPSRTDSYLEALLQSLQASEPAAFESIVVGDNGLSTEFRDRWPQVKYVPVSNPFVFARAINLAVSACTRNTDLLILNDDTTMVTSLWRQKAERLLRDPGLAEYGMISLAIDGGVGNSEQKRVYGQVRDVVEASGTICFVAVLIRRTAWDAVGGMDEDFVAYGWDDNWTNHRMRSTGWKCGVTQRVVVTHGAGGFKHSSSFLKYYSQEEADRMFYINKKIYLDKGGPLDGC